MQRWRAGLPKQHPKRGFYIRSLMSRKQTVMEPFQILPFFTKKLAGFALPFISCDSLALCCAIDPEGSIADSKAVWLAVECEGQLARGQTIVDWDGLQMGRVLS